MITPLVEHSYFWTNPSSFLQVYLEIHPSATQCSGNDHGWSSRKWRSMGVKMEGGMPDSCLRRWWDPSSCMGSAHPELQSPAPDSEF